MKVLSEQWVKIRKPHHCWGCTKEYPVGTKMQRITSVDGGEISSVYWCNVCDHFILTDKNAREDNQDGFGFSYGDLRDYENYPKEAVINAQH
jgi:hypothetical protein